MSQPAIYEAMTAVMKEITVVEKKERNQHFRFMFRGIDAVVNAVGPALRKHGVVVVPEVKHVSYENVTTGKGKPSTACRVLVEYSFHAVDGSSISATVAGEAWDDGDKATAKAMSVAFRIALLQSLTLPTDEPDPDHDSYEKAHPQQGGAPRGGGEQTPEQQAWQSVSQAFDAVGITDPQERKSFIETTLAKNIAGPGDLSIDEMKEVWDRLQPTQTEKVE